MSDDEETKVISVRLPSALVDEIDECTDNRTALVRRLFESYLSGGSVAVDGAVRSFRLKQLEHQLSSYEAQKRLVEEEIETLRNTTDPSEEAYFVELDEILDKMEERLKVDRELPKIENLSLEQYGDRRLSQRVIDDLRERAEEQDRDIDDDHWRDPEDRNAEGDPRDRRR